MNHEMNHALRWMRENPRQYIQVPVSVASDLAGHDREPTWTIQEMNVEIVHKTIYPNGDTIEDFLRRFWKPLKLKEEDE